MERGRDAGDEDAPLAGSVLSNKFKVERLLGKGGMGTVYVAEHLFTKRKGALKVLHRRFSAVPDIVERFIREASAAGVIGSRHIVETYDAGMLEAGEPYMFMELLHGTPVDQLLVERRRFAFEEARDIVTQAARGLLAAHEAGIVHRDIKPGNLFVVAGERPFVKLLDFGISKFAPNYSGNQNLTQEGRMLGTPLYMPPEQMMGQRDIDARADIYSLGVVFYEMLSGRTPFDAESLMELSVRVHQGHYPPVSQEAPGIPAAIDAVIARMLAVDRAQRFASVRAVLEALEQAFGSLPSLAPPSPPATQPSAAVASAPAPAREPASATVVQTLDALTATVEQPPTQPLAANVGPNSGRASSPSVPGRVAVTRRGPNRPLLALLAVTALLSVIFALWTVIRPKAALPPRTEALGVESAVQAAAAEPPAESKRTDSERVPLVPSVVGATPSASAPAPSGSQSPRATRPAHSASSPEPAAKQKGKQPTSRASQDGLSEDNPFAK